MCTHYDVLQVSADATQAQIRAAYKRRLLEVHPDKSALDGALHAAEPASPTTVQDVQRAWQVLSDADGRARYDASRCRSASEVVPWERVALADMDSGEASDGSAVFTFECRCGELFELSEAESATLRTVALLLQCSGCGNVLEVAQTAMAAPAGSRWSRCV